MLSPSCLTSEKCFFQQGSAPHRKNEAKGYLKGIFPDRCIAIEGPILWPAQSPDDDPTRYVKNMACQGNLNKMEKLERYTADSVAAVEELGQQTTDTVVEAEKLQQQTADTVAEVDASMLERTWGEIIDFLWSGRQTG
jgi:hypothetical protein